MAEPRVDEKRTELMRKYYADLRGKVVAVDAEEMTKILSDLRDSREQVAALERELAALLKAGDELATAASEAAEHIRRPMTPAGRVSEAELSRAKLRLAAQHWRAVPTALPLPAAPAGET